MPRGIPKTLHCIDCGRTYLLAAINEAGLCPGCEEAADEIGEHFDRDEDGRPIYDEGDEAAQDADYFYDVMNRDD